MLKLIMSSLFLHCRPGFEGECAAEIQDLAVTRGVSGYCQAKDASAFVVFHPHEAHAAPELHGQLRFRDVIFARQWFVLTSHCKHLPAVDRVTPLLEQARALKAPISDVFLEVPDTNAGKALSPLCRALCRPMREALSGGSHREGGTAEHAVRLHVCFLSGTSAYLGYALPANSAPWPMGIPRLKFPRGAPSRSTLKLEEAFWYFLTDEERERCLRPGMQAVDLGAAPGGWTWQLVRRHLRVTAVDNGKLAPQLLDSGVVEHVRADGFRYRPPKPVAWMVCDIVEQPLRVAELAGQWLARGWCEHAIFNLKLPMKKRYQEVRRCLAHIDGLLREAGVAHTMACKQLYHDREEVTVYVRRRAG
jgi:23S rRNA (cytidine2498-2'-O)-methyltransferase